MASWRDERNSRLADAYFVPGRSAPHSGGVIHVLINMMIHVRPAPAGQVARLLALGELHGLLERFLEIILGERPADAAPHEIRPQELAERRGVLGESADAA